MVIFSRATSHSSGTYTEKEEAGAEPAGQGWAGRVPGKLQAKEGKVPLPGAHRGEHRGHGHMAGSGISHRLGISARPLYSQTLEFQVLTDF